MEHQSLDASLEQRSTMTTSWRPGLGAWPIDGGIAFRVWAPTSECVTLLIENAGIDRRRPEDDNPPAPETRMTCARGRDGFFEARVRGLSAGSRYRYRLDDRGPFPDPASRYQPDGVHGASAVVDPRRFTWTDRTWKGRARGDLIIYELHVGTFSPEGTFGGVARHLPYLAELGVTAIELMPVADFAGDRNWGYDGVALFAPARCYGTPDGMRHLVDRAHALGIAVILDVVYNHFGPDGAYASAFSPYYFDSRHQTPWGAAVNLDGEHSQSVRAFLIENALHWVHEYHVDALRLDATHTLVDESPRHFLAELTSRVKESVRDREVLVIAEDDRNLARLVSPREEGGYGLDAVWSDDFHHQVRRRTAGDRESYYAAYTGSTHDLASTIRDGWFYQGQPSPHTRAPRGTSTGSLDYDRFIVCLQNHDQVGNRALGGRLNHEVTSATWRALTALLHCAPETPLLFMGQEWAASAPFLYFTDHHAELGAQVTAGRREEFRAFAAFSDPATRERIPDPQAPATFMASKLPWAERDREPHASALRCHRAFIALRRDEPALGHSSRGATKVVAPDERVIVVRREAPGAPAVLVAVCVEGASILALHQLDIARLQDGERWELLLTTEDRQFAADPTPPVVNDPAVVTAIAFARPSAVVLREMGPA